MHPGILHVTFPAFRLVQFAVRLFQVNLASYSIFLSFTHTTKFSYIANRSNVNVGVLPACYNRHVVLLKIEMLGQTFKQA